MSLEYVIELDGILLYIFFFTVISEGLNYIPFSVKLLPKSIGKQDRGAFVKHKPRKQNLLLSSSSFGRKK